MVNLSSEWTDRTGDPNYRLQLVDGAVKPPDAWNSVGNRIGISSYVRTMLFNDHKITAKMKTPSVGDWVLLYVRSSNSNQMFCLLVNGGSWYIGRRDGDYGGLANAWYGHRITTEVLSWVDGDKITLAAKGNCYIVYKNDVYQFGWADDEGWYSANVNQAHHECAISYVWNGATTGGIDDVWMDDLYIWPSMVGNIGDGVLAATHAGPRYERATALSGGGSLTATATRNWSDITEENTNRTNQAVPAGTFGCYITLIGNGGGGGSAAGSAFSDRGGGGGGGGAAVVQRSFIARSALGSTYSVTRGTGGTSGIAGTSSTFSSGSVSVSAGGGSAGVNVTSGGTGGNGGGGGTASVSGTTVSSTNGAAGGKGGTTFGTEAGANGGNGGNGAGGGGGGGCRYLGSEAHDGGTGGTSSFASGGTAGTSDNQAGGAGGNAGAGQPGGGGGGGDGSNAGTNTAVGGTGGTYGAGGGGGGGGNSTANGGTGGAGYTKVEWV